MSRRIREKNREGTRTRTEVAGDQCEPEMHFDPSEKNAKCEITDITVDQEATDFLKRTRVTYVKTKFAIGSRPYRDLWRLSGNHPGRNQILNRRRPFRFRS